MPRRLRCKEQGHTASGHRSWSRRLHACPAPALLSWGLVFWPHSPGERLCGKERRGCGPSALALRQHSHAAAQAECAGLPRHEHLEGPDLVLSPGLSMRLLESKKGLSYFAFEHSEEYQQTQHKFLAAVESMEPNNIVVRGARALGAGAGGDTWRRVRSCLSSQVSGLASQPRPSASELGAESHHRGCFR